VFPDPDAASAFLRAFMVTQFHCVWHSFGMDGVAKMRLKCPLNSPPPDARVLAEGYVAACVCSPWHTRAPLYACLHRDMAGVIVSMWALYGGPNDHPLAVVSTDPLFTNTVTKVKP
jgi:hypothetical protein